MRGQTFESIEKAQAFADAWLEKKNAEPKPEFLGLSSEQLHRMLYRPFDETSDIVALNKNLSSEKILEIPIVKEAVYFLRRLGELQPLRARPREIFRGPLPVKFMTDFLKTQNSPTRLRRKKGTRNYQPCAIF